MGLGGGGSAVGIFTENPMRGVLQAERGLRCWWGLETGLRWGGGGRGPFTAKKSPLFDENALMLIHGTSCY